MAECELGVMFFSVSIAVFLSFFWYFKIYFHDFCFNINIACLHIICKPNPSIK